MPVPEQSRMRVRRGVAVPVVTAALAWLLAGPGAAASLGQTPVPPAVAATIQGVQAKPAYARSTWGLSVVDLATGEVLISQNPDKLFTPGSIMKTYMSADTLHHYGPDHRFRTPVFRTGPVRAGRLAGDLVLVASGDTSMGLRDRPDGTLGFNSTPEIDHNYATTGLPGPTLVPDSHPLSGLNRLARQVRDAGIRGVGGDVVIDDRLFETESGWPDGLISPIWINENVIDITSKPTRPGRRAQVSYRPTTSAFRVQARVTTGAKDSDPSLTVEQTGPGTVRIAGSVPAGGGPVLQIFQIPDPAAFARTAFIDALRRSGVAVGAPATGANPARRLPRRGSYRARDRVALRVSPQLSQYTNVILKVSYNRGADLLACLAAVKAGSRNCTDGLASQVANNRRLGVPQDSTFPFDGAGSNDADRTAPGAMTTFLRNVAGQSYGKALHDGLPILGVDGTLRASGKGSPAAGKIQAKTGNRVAFVEEGDGLAGAQAHVGYIDAASGRRLVFADLLRDLPLAAPTDFLAADADQTSIETAIQQSY
jgi:D-alanyl-D-alanine carboxypeptidase/D-alanyl-D-alanine-endopeptidase (penicillin-binding protein 4)